MALELSLYTLESQLSELLEMREQTCESMKLAQTEGDLPNTVEGFAEEIAVIDNAIREYITAEIKKVDSISDFWHWLDRVAGVPKQRKDGVVRCEIDVEIARLTERRDRLRANLERIKSVVQFVMESMEWREEKPRKLEGVRHALYLKGNGGTPAVDVYAQELIPDELQSITVRMSFAQWMKLGVPAFQGTYVDTGPPMPALSLIAQRLNEKCPKCEGGEAIYTREKVIVDCPECGGTGKQSVPGARFAPVGQHVECK